MPAGTAHWEPTADTYTLTAAGANLWAKTDGFHFVWKKASGDLSLSADLDFPVKSGDPSPHRKAVLIFRQTLDASSAYADAAQHGSGLTALQYRLAPGATTQDIELNDMSPASLRLEKRGDVFTLFVGDGKGSFHQVGASIQLHLDGTFYVGIGLSAHNPAVVEKAVFSHVELKPLPPLATAPEALYSTLQTISIDENARVAHVAYTTRARFEAPNWTHDGKTLIFDQDGKIMKVPAAGGDPESIPIGAATKCNGSHGISPDGTMLAITCSMPDKPESRVYVVPLAGGTPRVVTENPYSYWHAWSPDGKTIVFTRPSHGSGNIYAIPLEGGEEKALTTGSGISDDPDFSPDGKYIYFNSDRGGSMQIWRMHAGGTDPEQMTSDSLVNWTPHVSPDGKSVVFQSYEHGTAGHPMNRNISLRILSLPDGKVRTLVNLVGGSGTMNVPSWAPDSQHLAFVSYQMLSEGDGANSLP